MFSFFFLHLPLFSYFFLLVFSLFIFFFSSCIALIILFFIFFFFFVFPPFPSCLLSLYFSIISSASLAWKAKKEEKQVKKERRKSKEGKEGKREEKGGKEGKKVFLRTERQKVREREWKERGQTNIGKKRFLFYKCSGVLGQTTTKEGNKEEKVRKEWKKGKRGKKVRERKSEKERERKKGKQTLANISCYIYIYMATASSKSHVRCPSCSHSFPSWSHSCLLSMWSVWSALAWKCLDTKMWRRASPVACWPVRWNKPNMRSFNKFLWSVLFLCCVQYASSREIQHVMIIITSVSSNEFPWLCLSPLVELPRPCSVMGQKSSSSDPSMTWVSPMVRDSRMLAQFDTVQASGVTLGMGQEDCRNQWTDKRVRSWESIEHAHTMCFMSSSNFTPGALCYAAPSLPKG